mmetsp:Transcript_56094/g.112457  ORF Transcript_56094/g.112457 Transcript_56094/m.112457 type:complete len:240 (-) Transcript_56094:198-917(-)
MGNCSGKGGAKPGQPGGTTPAAKEQTGGALVGAPGQPITVFLTYSGAAKTIGDPSSMAMPKNWLGFVADGSTCPALLASQAEEAASLRASAAPPGSFPIPSPIDASATALALIAEWDEAMTAPNTPDKVPLVRQHLQPSSSFSWHTAQDEKYCCYGPFHTMKQLLISLESDPMLQPVWWKWRGFSHEIFDGPLKYGEAIWLRIRWEGWFVRPMLEVRERGADALLAAAAAAADEGDELK